jgi:hypothetical protein
LPHSLCGPHDGALAGQLRAFEGKPGGGPVLNRPAAMIIIC